MRMLKPRISIPRTRVCMSRPPDQKGRLYARWFLRTEILRRESRAKSIDERVLFDGQAIIVQSKQDQFVGILCFQHEVLNRTEHGFQLVEPASGQVNPENPWIVITKNKPLSFFVLHR